MRKKNTVAIANIRRNIVDMWENKQNHDFHHFVNQNKKSMTNWPNKRIWWKSLPNRIQITTTIFKRENFFLYKYKLLQFFSPLFLAHIFLSTIYFPRCFWHNILHSHNELTGDGVKHTVLHIQNSPRSSIYILIMVVRVARTIAVKRNTLAIWCLQFINQAAPRDFY